MFPIRKIEFIEYLLCGVSLSVNYNENNRKEKNTDTANVVDSQHVFNGSGYHNCNKINWGSRWKFQQMQFL